VAAESDQIDYEEGAITRSTVPLSRQSTLQIQYGSEISSTPPDIEIEESQQVHGVDTHRPPSFPAFVYEPKFSGDVKMGEPQEVLLYTPRHRSLFTSPLSPVNTTRRKISFDSSEASRPD
jgi:hypothetical protein